MTPALVAAALCLDAVLGEPRSLWARVPHPAIIMGRAVGALDAGLNTGEHRKTKGILAVALLVLGAGLIGAALQSLGPLVSMICAAILIAQRSLIDHVRAVAMGLRQSPKAGQQAVAMIVSRDVSASTPSSTARSAIESLSENFSDGVVAPAFWFAVAGLPGIAIYKVVNTADSMIGYLTPRHAAFGWAAARLDDVLNWIPARMTALLIAVSTGIPGQWAGIRQDAALHRSPNAGWPEAAMAHGLDIALAGPRSYHGTVQDLAWVHPNGRRDLTPADIDAAILIVWKAWGVGIVALLGFGVLIWVF
ncbi:adenosylcobinamide-phosphate synthase CbiB [uncultured Tateyamaria sp.]|uniref:adenosylcobinamide-phosphate synthase CbiB n=1 Tax=uncultured Tateyamaria sp. TaxID=455651 RepID=UPI0026103770|nr:adenosylcobinamide-phosphate synthase CbiB [uncultured Tateyamaria sp.]